MTKYISFFILLATGMLFTACSTDNSSNDNNTDNYKYETVEGDPLGVRIYTLDNGLKVYISQNDKEPRVQTNIAVRTGSKQDPQDATGLAHYLEHMLFKGTSKLGSLDWEAEKAYLYMISELYEQHRSTQDPDERKRIYAQIDSISQIAAQYVVTNEYDKLISGLGAQGTNAYTSNERTVYINDIPSNELEKWLAIESERFNEVVLRLFHTELEAVYEEFNRGQDSDYRQAYYKLFGLLFPTHPYGQQTTIGTSEHLKNPSMVKIHEYFKKMYVPNNMAIVIAGDVDPDKAIALVDKYFGHYKRSEVEPFQFTPEKPITEPVIEDVYGSDAEFEMIAFRLDGEGSPDENFLPVFSAILSNGTAGLMDLNLIQKQKILKGFAYEAINDDYSWLTLYGFPKEGQSLEKVRELLLAQIDSIKAGNFEDWMLPAVIRNMKKSEMERIENNSYRASIISNAFILDEPWAEEVRKYEEMEKITKEALVAWANEKFGNNYAAVNKRIGEKDVVRVEKPHITPVPINRDTFSEFYSWIDTIATERIEPVFVDFKKEIQETEIKNGIKLSHIPNEVNELFSLYYILDMGKDHDKTLAVAVEYLPYLGTEDMSAEEVQQELFKLGLSFNVYSSRDKVYVMLNGLEESFEEGVAFFENLLANVEADPDAYKELVNDILKERADAKLSKGQILYSAMASYAMYGPENPFTNRLSEKELKAMDPEKLAAAIRDLTDYQHRVFYYGTRDIQNVAQILNEKHLVPENLKPYPQPKQFKELPTEENKVYFVDYDMVQTEMLMLSKDGVFNKEILPESRLFNEFFGAGLSSIVFQEIRESKALAYSAYCFYSAPDKADESHYVRAYIGTQANKLEDATEAILDLMDNMPQANAQFEQSKISAMKQIETNRTTGEAIFWSYEDANDLGLDYDINQEIYPRIEKMDLADMQQFFDGHVKGNSYTYLVIGKKSELDMEALGKLGPVKELTLEEVFGY